MIRAATSLCAILLLCTFTAASAEQMSPAAPDPYDPGRQIVSHLDHIVTPNGVDTLEQVRLGGVEQWISIRGADRNNPVLLFVHGGPGAPEMGAAWAFQRPWEDYFTVVNWDQRGAGKTLRSNGAAALTGNLTRARMTEDAGELMALLRQRFHKNKIIVVGHSWGNVVGLGAALAHPDWIAAYVGVGPLLNMQANEAASYAHVMAIAQQRHDAQAITELQSIAPYPGPALTVERLGIERKYVALYGGLAAYRPDADFYFHAPRISPLYDPADRAAIDAGGELSIPALLSDLSAVDFSATTHVSFPVIMFVGRHDLTTPPQVTERWLAALHAPS
jgi:pimeloyl-ACP methyl ester carboxylesterase